MKVSYVTSLIKTQNDQFHFLWHIFQSENSLNISSLFFDDIFTDCTVKSSDGHEIKLHRVILSFKSEVFKAMLIKDLKEGNTKVIELPEDFKLLILLFRLMYEMECKGNLSDFMELAIVTRKYFMMDLHKECVQALIDFLGAINAVEMLVFAVENGIEELKEKALSCVVE